ncbi:MAG: HD domain-containing protein [Sphingobacteriales bacterium]|nr:MAG: HD domain-containing protein [Sphingobacteriales bacterium]
MRNSNELPVLQKVQEVALATGISAYVVGGYVRDLLLNRPTKDVDILVIGNGPAFAGKVAEAFGRRAKLSVFKNFGTANLKTGDFEIEFVGARKESYQRNSRKPIVEEGTLEDDLKRRDFTINALAIALNGNLPSGEIIDMFGGLQDLENKILRTPLEPNTTFSDDPLRMMRAIRFASQLNFKLHDETYEAIKHNKERIKIISGERIADELNKIVLSDVPSIGFKLLEETGLLQIIFPEFIKLKGVQTINNRSHKDNFYHTLQVLDNIAPNTNNLWLRWAAILHDIGKPASQRFSQEEGGWTFHGHEVIGARMVPNIFKNLKLPLNEKMKYVQKLVLLHLRPIALTQEVGDSAIRRLIVDADNDLEDLLTLCKADVTSKNMLKVKTYLKRFDEVWEKIQEVEAKDQLRNWKPPITGEIVMETFGLQPSREVGIIKEAVKEAILNGDIRNDYSEAFDYMLNKGAELGFKPLNN